MAVNEIPHESLGLISVEDAAVEKGVTVRSVQRWVTAGWIPAVVIGTGKRASYLLRRVDLVHFTPPPSGARRKNPA